MVLSAGCPVGLSIRHFVHEQESSATNQIALIYDMCFNGPQGTIFRDVGDTPRPFLWHHYQAKISNRQIDIIEHIHAPKRMNPEWFTSVGFFQHLPEDKFIF